MDLYYELLKEFDRVVNQCDQGVNMPSNVNIYDNTGGSKEQGSMMQSISGGLGEAGSNVASPVVMNETLEVMKVVALAEQNGIEPSSFPSGEVNTPWPVNWKLDKDVPQFLSKVYLIVDDPMTDDVVHWGLEGKSFIVQDAVTFCNSILPKYFKHGNFSSFIRQLNTYGFRKIDCDKWEFATREFQRGKIHQLKNIKRKASVSKQMQLRSGKQDDTFQKHLKSLSAQISNLNQQLEVSSSIVSAYEKKMQDIELKYKQMASVLSKTIQNPGFVAERLKRKAFVQSKHGSDCQTEASSEQKMAEPHGITKLSSETAHVLCDCKSTAQSQTEMQLSPYIYTPSIGESSCSPNNPHGSAEVVKDDDSLQSLHNELMKEVEPCEGLGSDKCISYFHELLSLIPVDESDSGWVAYANQHMDKKPKLEKFKGLEDDRVKDSIASRTCAGKETAGFVMYLRNTVS